MESKNLDSKCVKCPVQIDFKYEQTMKTKAIIEINSRNKFILVKIKDEYSLTKDIDTAIEAILDKTGQLININQSESKKNLD